MNEKDKSEIKNRLDIFKKSFKEHQFDFGSYDPDPVKSRDAIQKIRSKKPY